LWHKAWDSERMKKAEEEEEGQVRKGGIDGR
jgi:hypothetical protein